MEEPPAEPEVSADRRRGSYAKGIERRQEILDRAIQVFAERGAEGTSMRAIGEAIGVSHAALGHYFDSREQLLVAVYRAAEDRTNANHPDPEGTTVVGKMTNSARRNHAVPGLVQLYTSLVAAALERGHDDAREFATGRFARVRAELVAQIERDQAAGRMRRDIDAASVASLVIAASDGLQVQWLLDPEIDPAPSLELLELLLSDDR